MMRRTGRTLRVNRSWKTFMASAAQRKPVASRLLQFAALCLMCAAPASAAVTIVQHKANSSSTSASTLTVTIAANSAGSLIVVGAGAGNNTTQRTISSVADNATGGSNTYTCDANSQGSSTSGTLKIATKVCYCLSAAHAGATTITITYSGSATYRDAVVWEVSGFTTAGFDTSAGTTNAVGVGTTDTGASVTTSGASGFVVGFIDTGGWVTVNPKSGNEFTAGGDITSNNSAGCSLISASAAAHQPVWTDGNSAYNFAASTLAIKETHASSSCTPTLTLSGVGRCG
jgi:hypothetical protein